MMDQMPAEVEADEPAEEGQEPTNSGDLPVQSKRARNKDSKSPAIQMKHCRTIRATGARLREVRVDLCNMSLSYAAEQLGYSNPSKLSKVENASDGFPIPLWLVVEASKLYEVSTDFLLGASDDWERSARMTQEREVSRFQAEQIEKAIRNTCDLARRFNDELEWASGTIIGMAFSVEEVAATLKRVTDINVESWQDVKGGSKLADEADKALQLVTTARAGLKRFKRTLAAPMLGDGLLKAGA